MFNKLLKIIGFNSSENYVGLSQLRENRAVMIQTPVTNSPKELKLSDLMRGN